MMHIKITKIALNKLLALPNLAEAIKSLISSSVTFEVLERRDSPEGTRCYLGEPLPESAGLWVLESDTIKL